MATKKVVVLGGGVAGMSAAHELINKGYEVHVYERNSQYCGGKARSVEVPGTNLLHPDKYLPGEHGFRFFPGFYKHVTQTMSEIPFKRKDGSISNCLENLVPTSRIRIARYNHDSIITVSRFPRRMKDLKLLIEDMHVDADITKEGKKFFAERMWQLMTSSTERRNEDYEGLGWWDYLDAGNKSFGEGYVPLLVEGLTRTLVAAQAETASTKTGGNIFLQLIFNMVAPGVNTDRVLNSPTNDAWLNPWLDYLKDQGVQYHLSHEVKEIKALNGEIKSAVVQPLGEEPFQVEADYFVCAVPVEKAAELLNDELIKLDSSLGKIKTLAKDTNWMNGIQYFLNKDIKITGGHCIYSNSEWAVTSISQMQFWENYELKDRFNGKVKGVLSVDVSDWSSTPYKGHLAEDLPADEVAKGAWEQMQKSLNLHGKVILGDYEDVVLFHYVDRDIKWDTKKHQNIDKEPLLVNKVNTWELRPEAYCNIPNLFFASDYVRTNTDLATMEGANEAARRAVNAILEKDGSNSSKCKVWSLKEPWLFAPLKWLDKRRFSKGEPYSLSIPWWMKIFMFFYGGVYALQYFLKVLWFELIGKRFKK